VSPEEFVHVLAQLLHGAGADAPEQLAQKIGDAPAELESDTPRKPETPGAEQTAPSALAVLAVELVPVAPPAPPPPPVAQDPGPRSALESGPPVAEALTPSAVPDITRGLSKAPPAPGQLPGLSEDAPEPAPAESIAPKPLAASPHAPATPAPEAVPPAAREEEPRPPAAGSHATSMAPEVRPEVTHAIGATDAGGFRGSLDGDRGSDRGRSEREAGSNIGGVTGPMHSTAQPAPDAVEGATHAASASPRAPVEQVAERVGLAHREGREEVSFRLDPPELGAVRIQAVLEGQRLTLHIRTEHEAARAALEQSMPQLKESLSQQGIVAGRVTIELGLDTSPRGFAGQGFAGSPREETGDVPARSNAVSVPRRTWSEMDRRGVDLWV
jgi:hypothetical protein